MAATLHSIEGGMNSFLSRSTAWSLAAAGLLMQSAKADVDPEAMVAVFDIVLAKG